jgi:hypothetical protein
MFKPGSGGGGRVGTHIKQEKHTIFGLKKLMGRGVIDNIKMDPKEIHCDENGGPSGLRAGIS